MEGVVGLFVGVSVGYVGDVDGLPVESSRSPGWSKGWCFTRIECRICSWISSRIRCWIFCGICRWKSSRINCWICCGIFSWLWWVGDPEGDAEKVAVAEVGVADGFDVGAKWVLVLEMKLLMLESGMDL